MGPAEFVRGAGGVFGSASIGLVEVIVVAIAFYGGFWLLITIGEGLGSIIRSMIRKFQDWKAK